MSYNDSYRIFMTLFLYIRLFINHDDYISIDVKAVSEHLGHCNIAITGDIYSHIFEEYKARIAKCLEDDLIS